MNIEEIKAALENGGRVDFKCWSFYKTHYECCECDSGCSCGDGFRDIDDAVNTIMLFAAGEEHLIRIGK